MVREDKVREKNKTISQLKAQIKQLRKHLKMAHSELELIRELWAEDVLDMARKQRRHKIEEKRKPSCPQCGNPTISTNLLGIWKLSRCESCDFFNREKITQDENE